jgi:hypothetical protein
MTPSGTLRRYTKRSTTTDSDTVKEVVIEDTEIELPANLKDASLFDLVDGVGIQAQVSPVYEPKKPDNVMEALTDKSFIAACVCVVLAGACFWLRLKRFPMIPSYAPVGLGGLAVAFYMAPVILDRYSLWLALGGIGFVAWCVYGYLHNTKLRDKQPSVESMIDVG